MTAKKKFARFLFCKLEKTTHDDDEAAADSDSVNANN